MTKSNIHHKLGAVSRAVWVNVFRAVWARISAPKWRIFLHPKNLHKNTVASVLTSIISLMRATAKPTPVGERDLMASFFFKKIFLTPTGMAEEFKDDCEAI